MTHLTAIQLNEYLDNVLDASARRTADSHLRSCEDCRSRLAELRNLFAHLSALPEARLSHDLTASVLARLPGKRPPLWTPAFAAQLGAALGAFLWLSVEVTKFALPMLAAFSLPQLAVPAITLTPAAFNFQRWGLDLLRFWTTSFRFTLPNLAFALPRLHVPTVDFPLPTFGLGLIAVSAFVLWLVGNAALLRGGPEAKR